MDESYRCVSFMPCGNDNDDNHRNGDNGDNGDDEDNEEWTRVTDV